MHTQYILLEQFDANYNATAWFATIQTAINGISEEVALYKPAAAVNSIKEIADHLIFWNNRYLQRFTGNKVPDMIGGNETTFRPMPGETWEITRNKLLRVLEQFREAINSTGEQKLATPFSEKLPATWASIIAHINTHNAYHIGQIIVLRKLQNAWPQQNSVG